MNNDKNELSTFQIIMNKLIKKESKNYLFVMASNNTKDFVILLIHQSSYIYCEKYELEDLKKINFFKNFQNLNVENYIELMKKLFEEKKDSIEIDEEEDKQIKISLNIELSVSGLNYNLKSEKIEFILQNDKLEQIVRYNLIWFSVLFLFREKEEKDKINEEHKKNIEILMQQIFNLKTINEELKLKLSKFEFNLNNNKINNKVIKNIFNDSKIINETNINKMQFITQKLKRLFIEKSVTYQKVYSAKLNGDTSSKFHELCDYINNTLTIVHTDTNKIFGGFAFKTWNSFELGRKSDTKSFIFSLDKQKIYNPILGEQKFHLYCSENEGPCFYAFSIENFCLEKGGYIDEIKKCNFESFEEEYEINDGNKNFKIIELEVYKVLFENNK